SVRLSALHGQGAAHQPLSLSENEWRGECAAGRPAADCAGRSGSGDRRATAPAEKRMTPVLLPQIVCCWCVPSHVVREGAPPSSHGPCPVAVAKLLAECAAYETARAETR